MLPHLCVFLRWRAHSISEPNHHPFATLADAPVKLGITRLTTRRACRSLLHLSFFFLFDLFISNCGISIQRNKKEGQTEAAKANSTSKLFGGVNRWKKMKEAKIFLSSFAFHFFFFFIFYFAPFVRLLCFIFCCWNLLNRRREKNVWNKSTAVCGVCVRWEEGKNKESKLFSLTLSPREEEKKAKTIIGWQEERLCVRL